MTELTILAWLSPVILIVLMIGFVAAIAIRRADTKDIPTIVRDVMAAFRRIGVSLPGPDGKHDTERIGDTRQQYTDGRKGAPGMAPPEFPRDAIGETDSDSK